MELPAVLRLQPITKGQNLLTIYVQLIQWLHGKQQQQHSIPLSPQIRKFKAPRTDDAYIRNIRN